MRSGRWRRRSSLRPVTRRGHPSRPGGRVVGDAVVAAPVRADHVDALPVLFAVEDLPAVRRPGEGVLGVGMVGDDMGIASVRVDDGDPVVAEGASPAEVDHGRGGELCPVRRPLRRADAGGEEEPRPAAVPGYDPECLAAVSVGDLAAEGRPGDAAADPSARRRHLHRLAAADRDDVERQLRAGGGAGIRARTRRDDRDLLTVRRPAQAQAAQQRGRKQQPPPVPSGRTSQSENSTPRCRRSACRRATTHTTRPSCSAVLRVEARSRRPGPTKSRPPKPGPGARRMKAIVPARFEAAASLTAAPTWTPVRTAATAPASRTEPMSLDTRIDLLLRGNAEARLRRR